MAGIVLINPETQSAESFDPQSAQQALSNGYHVPLNDPNGDHYFAPIDEARQLVQQGGYSQPTPEQLQYLLDKTKYTTPEQQAKSFAEGFTESNIPGAGYIADKLGIANSEDQLKRKEHNPGTHMAGEMAGLGTGLLLAPETSVPGLIAKAGNAGREAVAAATGAGLVGKAAQIATQGAIEGALFSGTHEINERLLGDPNATAENMVAHIGLSSALGGGLSLAMAPAVEAISNVTGMGAGFLGRVSKPEAMDAAIQPRTLQEILPYTGTSQAERDSVIRGLGELKPNVKQIDEAGARLGIRPLESQRSANELVQHTDVDLTKSPTWAGQARKLEFKKQLDALSSNLDSALGNDIGMTKAQVGDALKSGLIDQFHSDLKPINELYDNIKGLGRTIPLEQEAIKGIADEIPKIDGLLSSRDLPISERSPSYQLAKRVQEELPSLGTVDDLRRYSEQLRRDTIASPELKYVAGQIQGKINELQENTVINYAKELNNPELTSLIETHKSAKKLYAEMMDKMGDIGQVIGKKLRRGEGPQAFMDWLEDATPEKITERLFTKKNSKFLSLLDEKFPNQAQLLKNYVKSDLRDAASENGGIVPAKLLNGRNGINKLEPEIKDFLFSKDELQKVNDVNTLWESFPKNFNFSNTAEAMRLHDFLDPTKAIAALGRQLGDVAKKSFVKTVVGASPSEAPLIMALVHMNNLGSKFATQVERHAGAIFGKELSDQRLEKQDKENAATPIKVNKLGNMIQAHAINPEGLIDHLSNAQGPMNDHLPQTMASMTGTIGRAVNFLASKLPDESKKAPLDAKSTASNVDIAKFNRYAEVANNPLSVLKHVKNGTLVASDLETLATVYPTAYNQMKEAVVTKLLDHLSKKNPAQIPYKTRLGLSMFLGENLDSTLSPMSIQSNQASLAMGRMQQQAADQQMQEMKPSKVGMRQMKSVANTETNAQSSLNRHGRNA